MTFRIATLAAVCASAAVLLAPVPKAEASQCGWFAIGHCAAGSRYPKNPMGWAIVNTSTVDGFRNGYHCIASGPQTKSGARRDRNILKMRWGVKTAYIKRGCANFGE